MTSIRTRLSTPSSSKFSNFQLCNDLLMIFYCLVYISYIGLLISKSKSMEFARFNMDSAFVGVVTAAGLTVNGKQEGATYILSNKALNISQNTSIPIIFQIGESTESIEW